MNTLKQRLVERYSLSIETLLNELSQRLNLDADNQQIFTTLGMVLLAHSGDTRRKSDSCISHLLRVALFVGDYTNNDPRFINLALLHDLIEDYPEYLPGTVKNLWQEVEKEYGTQDMEILKLLTHPPEVEHEEATDGHIEKVKSLWLNHIQYILNHEDAALIKLADFTDNLMTTISSEHRRFFEILKEKYFPAMEAFEKTFSNSSKVDPAELKEYFDFIRSY